MSILCTLALVPLLAPAYADTPAKPGDFLGRGAESLRAGRYTDAVAAFTRAAELDPKLVAAYEQRGVAHFFAGQPKESVADFDRAVALQPDLGPGHWRRGLSLYYAGEFEKGERQFESSGKGEPDDVENAAWHFFCAARREGVDKARKRVLKVGRDRRPVMMTVYDLCRGTATPADVLAAAEAGELSAKERRSARFYAHLYVGLFREAEGDLKVAERHLARACEYRADDYMGQLARVHLDLLRKPKR